MEDWTMNLREAMVGTLSLALTIAATPAGAQNYPQKPVRFVLPFPPGGGTDTLGRVLGQKLGETLGQQVLIDNRPGAGANIGAEVAAKAPPDGYTIFMGNVAHTINATLYSRLNYDLLKDFAPVTMLGRTPNLVVVHPSLPTRSVKDLIALAKAKPNALNYASSGSGSSSHLAGELFKILSGIKMVHVPYKGGGPAVTSLMAGEASVGFATMPSVLTQVMSGKLRGLAVTGSGRSQGAPELPTVSESGLPGYEATTWYCLLVPAGTSKDVVARLNTDATRVLASTDVVTRLTSIGYEIGGTTPDQLAAYMKSEIQKWGKVVKATDIKAD
jgi:tripartite-type tricarboxylate transporter receptor subunit TctC